jgi:polysaccharide export outer membrane protein
MATRLLLRGLLAVFAASVLPGAAAAQDAAAAPVEQQAPAAAPTRSGAVTAYRINPGDELEVFVWGEERLQRAIRVLPDGSFSFPLVGRVDALNKLPSELETVISKGLETQYRGAVPQVTVSVRSPAGMQFSVVGKVRNPGTFTPGRYVNVLEALSFAGGPTEFAQLGNIIVIRKEGEGLSSFRVRLNDTLRGAPSEDNLSTRGIPQVRGGDTVIVP